MNQNKLIIQLVIGQLEERELMAFSRVVMMILDTLDMLIIICESRKVRSRRPL